MVKTFFLNILTSCLLLASCNENEQKPKRVINEETGVTGLERTDPTFLRLKDTAQKYIEDFIGSLQQHAQDTNYAYVIKSDFMENDTHEHMWSTPFRFDGNGFTCIFADSAYDLHNVKAGDTIFVKTKDVEDWVIYDYVRQTKTGSFSDKYLRGDD